MTLSIPQIDRLGDMTTQEYAYLRLRNAIMLGKIPPGTPLTLRNLVGAFELSQTPIREAVRRLTSENAIEVMGNRRLRIPAMTAHRFEELVLLRIKLETHSAERALPYVSDMDISDLADVDQKMDEAVSQSDFDRLTKLNQKFHKMLYCLNPNQVALPMIESLWLQIGPFQRVVLEDLHRYYSVDRHKEMLSALRQRDAVKLTAAVDSDIRDGLVRNGRKLLQDQRTMAPAADH